MPFRSEVVVIAVDLVLLSPIFVKSVNVKIFVKNVKTRAHVTVFGSQYWQGLQRRLRV